MLHAALLLIAFLVMLPFPGPAGSLQANEDETLSQTGQKTIMAADQTANDNHAQGARCERNDMNQAVLDRINHARSQPRQCGEEKFEAAEPLTWNCQLEAAAQAHSTDMAKKHYFSHTGPDGVGIRERVDREGYDWTAVGENIAAGQPSASAVVESWLSSPGHCANIMNPDFTEMGVARADEPASKYSPYWTQVLAKPR